MGSSDSKPEVVDAGADETFPVYTTPDPSSVASLSVSNVSVVVEEEEEKEALNLDLSSPSGRSNGTMTAWLEKWVAYLGRLEDEHDPAHVPSVKEIISPGSVLLFALSCTGMLGVGFRIGHLREVRKDRHGEVPGSFRDRMFKKLGFNVHAPAPVDPSGLSLRARANLKKMAVNGEGTISKVIHQQAPKVPVAPVSPAQAALKNRADILARRKPIASAPELAFKALGYATILTVSATGFTAVSVKWYFQIGDMEDLVWRLKHTVPRAADSLRGVIGVPLEGLRDSMQGVFKALRPAIGPKGSEDGDLYASLDQERAELRSIGISPEGLLDPQPPQPHNIAHSGSHRS